jgi:predicted nucleic acid-binding protein
VIAYADTSAVIKRVLSEPGSDVAVDIWKHAERVVSSEMVYPEARAALAAARRTGRLDGPRLRKAACRLEHLFGDLELVRMDDAIATDAGGLAEQHRLRGYDAVHLAAALSIDAPRVVVATWDRELAVASNACGMAVVPKEAATSEVPRRPGRVPERR